MKISSTLLFIATSIFLLVSCQKDPAQTAAQSNAPTSTTPTTHIFTNQKTQAGRIYGKIIEIINASGYTYVHVDDGITQTWAAGPATSVNNGDMIAFATGMEMKNFHSKSMQRDFDVIYFVDRFNTDKVTTEVRDPVTPESPGKIAQQKSATPIEGVHKLKGGNSIAEVFTHKKSLQGKTIRVRGKVTKFTPEIMGKNWLHIRDSSTQDDLTLTTNNTVKVGDIIIAEGKLELDKDFGYGYVYPVIVEDAQVTKE